jgi:hypothetical protein
MRRALVAASLGAAAILMAVPNAWAQTAVASGTVVSRAPMSGTATVAVNAPKISSFTPGKGPMGTIVTITGTGFTGTTKVTFALVAAQFKVLSSTRISATVPCGAATGRIRVSNAKGTATTAKSFTMT